MSEPIDVLKIDVLKLFYLWADAVVETSKERGVDARVWPAEVMFVVHTCDEEHDEHELVIDYGWTTFDMTEENSQLHWNAVHEAMVKHEALRPSFVRTSPALTQLLLQQN